MGSIIPSKRLKPVSIRFHRVLLRLRTFNGSTRNGLCCVRFNSIQRFKKAANSSRPHSSYSKHDSCKLRHFGLLWKREGHMKPTIQGTDCRPARHPHYPSITDSERLATLQSIQAYGKARGQRLSRVLRQVGKTHCRCGRLSPVYGLDTNAIIYYTDDEPAAATA
jgi:hypothetical protein